MIKVLVYSTGEPSEKGIEIQGKYDWEIDTDNILNVESSEDELPDYHFNMRFVHHFVVYEL